MLELRIDSDHAGVRLDKVLRQRLPRVPTSHLQKMIRTKKVRVNGRRARPEQPLAEGDVLTIRGDERALLGEVPVPARAPAPGGGRSPPHPPRGRLDDGSGQALWPRGSPGSGIRGGTLVDLVRAHLGPAAERNGFSASPAHRLDRETSGVIVVAKRRPAMVHFTEVFTHGGARKRYLTLAKGTFPRAEGRIDLPLSEHQQSAESEGRRGVNMQEAATRYRVLRRAGRPRSSRSRWRPAGRTRSAVTWLPSAHRSPGTGSTGTSASTATPALRWGLKRLFLHAERLELPHPETGARMPGGVGAPPELVDVLRRAGIPRRRRHRASNSELHARPEPSPETGAGTLE
jgi:23S rRNA pseudouridine955/2504/2580 synthase